MSLRPRLPVNPSDGAEMGIKHQILASHEHETFAQGVKWIHIPKLPSSMPLIGPGYAFLLPDSPIDALHVCIRPGTTYLVGHCEQTGRSSLTTFDAATTEAILARRPVEALSHHLNFLGAETRTAILHFRIFQSSISFDAMDDPDDGVAGAIADALLDSPATFSIPLIIRMKRFSAKGSILQVRRTTTEVGIYVFPTISPTSVVILLNFDELPLLSEQRLHEHLRITSQSVDRNYEPPMLLRYDGREPRYSFKLGDLARKALLDARGGEGWDESATPAHVSISETRERVEETVSWRWCDVCGERSREKLKACAGCGGGAYYCSVEHQKRDWPLHKSWYVAFPRLRASRRRLTLSRRRPRRCKAHRVTKAM